MIQYQDFLKKLRGAEDKGNYLVGRCPFHNDGSPSLLVFKDGWFRCLAAGCQVVGSWKMLWNKVQGQSVQIQSETRTRLSPSGLGGNQEELAYQAYIDLIHRPGGTWYLETRGLDDAVDLHEIGYHQGWYTFPVWDRNGIFQSLVFRAAPHVQEATGTRYWSKNAPTLYVPDWHLIDKSDYILVPYGIMDALTLNKLRYPAATPTHGHTFNPAWLDDYSKPVYFIPDKDEERSALRHASQMGWRGRVIYLDYPDGMKDANDFLKAGREKELVAQLERKIR